MWEGGERDIINQLPKTCFQGRAISWAGVPASPSFPGQPLPCCSRRRASRRARRLVKIKRLGGKTETAITPTPRYHCLSSESLWNTAGPSWLRSREASRGHGAFFLCISVTCFHFYLKIEKSNGRFLSLGHRWHQERRMHIRKMSITFTLKKVFVQSVEKFWPQNWISSVGE